MLEKISERKVHPSGKKAKAMKDYGHRKFIEYENNLSQESEDEKVMDQQEEESDDDPNKIKLKPNARFKNYSQNFKNQKVSTSSTLTTVWISRSTYRKLK